MGWRGGCLALGLVCGAVRHYCLGGCSALVVCARRSRLVRGGRAGAWWRVPPVSPFPPRVSRAVCGGPSRPGVPCPRSLVRHSMRSVRSAGSVRLPFWYSPRVLCVCVRSRSRGVCAPPLPRLVWRAHFAQSQCWALVGPFHSARAPPRFLPRSRATLGSFFFVFVLSRGGRPVPLPPYLAWGCLPPVRWACAPRAFPRSGVGWGGWGGAACVPFPRSVRLEGQWGWGSPCLGPSLCLPWAGNKAGALDIALAMEGVAPIPFRFACCLLARSLWRPCAQARVRLSIAVPAGAGGWGLEAGPAPASLPGAAVLPGGGGITATASGGLGAGIAVACGSVGRVGGSGGIAPWLPSSLSGGGGPRPSGHPPSRRRRIPSRCTRSAGVVGQPAAGEPAWRGGGGGP